MFAINIKNLDSLSKRLDRIADIDLEDAIRDATVIMHGQAVNLAPAAEGGLRESIHMDVKRKGNKTIGRVYTNLSYAAYVEFGTGSVGMGTYPYAVKGLKLKYTNRRWVYTPDDGETFFTTSGQPAQPYMYPAFKHSEKQMNAIVKGKLSKAVEDNCKGK